jgi:hypothetical protein
LAAWLVCGEADAIVGTARVLAEDGKQRTANIQIASQRTRKIPTPFAASPPWLRFAEGTLTNFSLLSVA